MRGTKRKTTTLPDARRQRDGPPPPRNAEGGGFVLESSGTRFGDVGFYRLSRARGDRRRVWYIRTLRERSRLYVDPDGDVRCDHDVSFLGLRVLSLHYRLHELPSGRT